MTIWCRIHPLENNSYKQMKHIAFFLCLILASCSSSSNDDGADSSDTYDPEDPTYDWIVPQNEVLGNFSLFPLAYNPILYTASNIDFIDDNTIVAAISFGNEIRVYPANHVHSFEAVNDQMESKNYAITYCPITLSTVGFNTDFESKTFTLRASGYLYKENQVLYDTATDSYWSQMELRCIKGVYQSEFYETFNLIETTWETVKTYFPDARVFTNASVSKSSPTNSSNKPPENNEPIYGIVEFGAKENSVHAYRLGLFSSQIKIYTQKINGVEIIVVGNEELRFITSYMNNENIDFTPVQNDFPNIMQDNDGNVWNVFGIATSGPRMGEQLSSPKGFFASWWAWEDFYNTIDVKE